MKCMHCGRAISKLINGHAIGPVCAEHLGLNKSVAVRDELTIDWVDKMQKDVMWVERINLKVVKAQPWAKLPTYATDGSACFDLYATMISTSGENSLLFDTGLRFEVPTGYAMMIYSRSGHGFANGVRLSNCVGVIDSDYRGSVMIKLHADKSNGILLLSHMAEESDKLFRVAQAMLIPVTQCRFEEVSELTETERGQGGFGSTGTK